MVVSTKGHAVMVYKGYGGGSLPLMVAYSQYILTVVRLPEPWTPLRACECVALLFVDCWLVLSV